MNTDRHGSKPRVALRGHNEPQQNLQRALDLEGTFAGLAAKAGRVFIKPNVTYPMPSGTGAVTDSRVLGALIGALRDAGAGRIIVGDGPGKSLAHDGFEVAGYLPFGKRYDVTFVDLNRARTRTVVVESPRAIAELEIPEVVLDADLFITVSPLKTHSDGLLTLNAKNLFGIPPTRYYGSPRAILHLKGVDEVVHDICRAAPPHYVIADATTVMELGVARGRPVAIGAIVAGRNLVATDAVSARLIGRDPREVPHLVYLNEDGLGPLDLEDIDLVGDPLDGLAQRLELTRDKTPRDWAVGDESPW